MKKIIVLLMAGLLFVLTSCGSFSADHVEVEKIAPSSTEVNRNQLSNDSNGTSKSESENSGDFLPLELTDYGYGVDNGYLYCAVILHNPNTDYCVDFPKFRIYSTRFRWNFIG